MRNPGLSIIVIVYNMPRQAMNTLLSLALPYQKNVSADEYEVIVVENCSDNNLDACSVAALGPQFRYFLRDEKGVSPVPAVNFAFSQCRGNQIGLIIDGARMVTPRVLEYAMLGAKISDASIDHGSRLSPWVKGTRNFIYKRVIANNWKSKNWQKWNGRIMVIDSSNGLAGAPVTSAVIYNRCRNAAHLFCSADNFRSIGGADERFDQPGGGSINLYLYRKLGMLPEIQLFVLPGEGSFHQFHGGVTTQEFPEDDARKAVLKSFDTRLEEVWGAPFKALSREPMLLGAVTHWAQPFLEKASDMASQRFARLSLNKKSFWDDDATFTRFTENAVSGLDDGYQPPAIMQHNSQQGFNDN